MAPVTSEVLPPPSSGSLQPISPSPPFSSASSFPLVRQLTEFPDRLVGRVVLSRVSDATLYYRPRQSATKDFGGNRYRQVSEGRLDRIIIVSSLY